MTRCREPVHVGADLGDDAFGGAFGHPGDRAEPVAGFSERDTALTSVGLEEGVDLLVEAGHRRFEVFGVVE